MINSSEDQAQNEAAVIIHDSHLSDILENFPDQINGMQALFKRLRIMLRMSKGNINHWHWASQKTWVEWCGVKLTQFKRLDATWLEQGWFEKKERPGRSSHVRLGRLFDVYRTQPQNVVNTQAQNVADTWPQIVADTWPQNVANTQAQNVANTWPQIVATKSKDINSQKMNSQENKSKEKKSSSRRATTNFPIETTSPSRRPKWAIELVEPFRAVMKGKEFIDYETLYSLLERFGSELAAKRKLALMISENCSPDSPAIEWLRKAGKDLNDQELCEFVYQYGNES